MSLRGAVSIVLDSNIQISKFEPQLRYYIHFQINTLEIDINSITPPSYGLNSISSFLRQGWLWH